MPTELREQLLISVSSVVSPLIPNLCCQCRTIPSTSVTNHIKMCSLQLQQSRQITSYHVEHCSQNTSNVISCSCSVYLKVSSSNVWFLCNTSTQKTQIFRWQDHKMDKSRKSSHWRRWNNQVCLFCFENQLQWLNLWIIKVAVGYNLHSSPNLWLKFIIFLKRYCKYEEYFQKGGLFTVVCAKV